MLAVLLFLLSSKSGQEVRSTVLNWINPVKSQYRIFTREIKDKSHSYLFQKEQIEKLGRENRVLRKYLLDQTHYLRQVAILYKKLPSLEKLPYKSIVLVDTISYVKLNKFDEILLNIPGRKPLEEEHVYGLIQDEVVAGTARMSGGHLYGYLISNPKCRFGVFVGKKRYPGIAVGIDKNVMAVKFIPKWAKIEIGDRVETSGLDRIFFAHIPVGTVQQVIVEGSYQTAYISTHADTMHPNLFFLITDPSPYLVSYYDQNKSFPERKYLYGEQKKPLEDRNISSIPATLQTQEIHIDPSEFEIPMEKEEIRKPKSGKPRGSSTISKNPATVSKPGRQKHVIQAPTEKRKKKRPSPFDILNTGFF